MVEWKEYIEKVIGNNSCLDNVKLFFDNQDTSISPIVEASLAMHNEMFASGYLHNIFVFPEISQIAKEYVVANLINNIYSGQIKTPYDPTKFKKGQKLKFDNCVCEFDRIENNGRNEFIYLKFSNLTYGVPISVAPFLQMANSERLSKYETYYKAYQKRKEEIEKEAYYKDDVTIALSDYKTYLDGSIVYISSIKETKDFLLSAEINNKKLSEVLLLGHINGDGEISNICPGQLSGNPAIVLASDLYSVLNAIENNNVKIQSIIVNGTHNAIVENQLDAFDALNTTNVPITVITDTVGSFSLDGLKARGYMTWMWNKESLTSDLLQRCRMSRHLNNCSNHFINYKTIGDCYISEAVNLLRVHRQTIEDQTPQIFKIYNNAFSIAFNELRCPYPMSEIDVNNIINTLSEDLLLLESEKRFISEELFIDLKFALTSLRNCYVEGCHNGKVKEIADYIEENQTSTICIVIPENISKSRCEEYWKNKYNEVSITVLYPVEYKKNKELVFDITIVPGWFNNTTMRTILYRYDSSQYFVLTYPCEERWQKSHTKGWKKQLANHENKQLLDYAIHTHKEKVSSSLFDLVEEEFDDESQKDVDEFFSIETQIRNGKYRQYSSHGDSVVEAIPVSFAGGQMSFYRKGHGVITATDIVQQTGDQIKTVKPEDLNVGDFIVIREASRDIIRDIADYVLEKSSQKSLRSIAMRWKESLSVETLFSSNEEIYKKLKGSGCKRDFVTVKNWINNDELITPQDKEDLICIAAALDDEMLLDQIDLIYDAGRIVKNAHVQAGRILSARLRNKIAEEIVSLGEIDVFNIWDPISIALEEVGNVKILKIIDIGDSIMVDTNNTNKLVFE